MSWLKVVEAEPIETDNGWSLKLDLGKLKGMSPNRKQLESMFERCKLYKGAKLLRHQPKTESEWKIFAVWVRGKVFEFENIRGRES